MAGLIHLYCGDGKGKTTCSVGLAVRMAGCGGKVVFLQFLKGSESGEIAVLKNIEGITVLRNDKDYGFLNSMTEKEKAEITKMHTENLIEAIEMINNDECDMLILDEICAAYEYNVIDKKVVDELINNKPEDVEIVLTGRNPAEMFVNKADYITEMKLIRHPYEKGIMARKGIEY